MKNKEEYHQFWWFRPKHMGHKLGNSEDVAMNFLKKKT